MAVTCFSQRDPRWGRRMLGTSRLTLQRYGGLVCSVASCLHDLGVSEMDPGGLNEWLRLGGGYWDGALLIWSALAALDVQAIVYDYRDAPASLDGVRSALARGGMAIAHVDFQPGGPVNVHWVRLLEERGPDWLMMDPWAEPGTELGSLLAWYALPGWEASRAIFAVAILERVQPDAARSVGDRRAVASDYSLPEGRARGPVRLDPVMLAGSVLL